MKLPGDLIFALIQLREREKGKGEVRNGLEKKTKKRKTH